MSSNIITRTAVFADMEIRGSDGRTVHGIAMPFDTPTEIKDHHGEYTEVFRHGAFKRTLAERGAGKVKVLLNHDMTKPPLGRLHSAREDTDALRIEAHIAKTAAGDEALELVREGALDSFSIRFLPVRERWGKGNLREHNEVKLYEVSLVTFPAYEGARIAGVRAAQPYDPDLDPDIIARRFRLAHLL
jgi:HK97 family phage prohead protease